MLSVTISSEIRNSEPWLAVFSVDAEQMWQFFLQERDQKNFQRLCDALRVVGFSQEDMDSIFQARVTRGSRPSPVHQSASPREVLAGLVHLGDLSKAERDEGGAGCLWFNQKSDMTNHIYI